MNRRLKYIELPECVGSLYGWNATMKVESQMPGIGSG
jgi:hypothetical protein